MRYSEDLAIPWASESNKLCKTGKDATTNLGEEKNGYVARDQLGNYYMSYSEVLDSCLFKFKIFV